MAGVDAFTVKAARAWFRNAVYEMKGLNAKKVMAQAGPFQNVNMLSANSIGKMYLFEYDAKWKKELPYWDKYPLIFPIEFWPAGTTLSNGRVIKENAMLGINLHYLSPYMRAILMDKLYDLLNNEKMDKTTKLQISYQILKSAAKYKLFKPCVHMYLFSHVKSPFMNVNPKDWDAALAMPLQSFQKANEQRVYFESLLKQ